MIPPRVLAGFSTLPDDLVGLCRPHSWEQLTASPAEGLRPIKVILLHMAGAEAFWIQHVVLGKPRPKFPPEDYASLDSILDVWKPQRAATIALVQGWSVEERAGTRAFPWDHNERASVEDIVWHVVTHEQYHRGQVFTRLALLGRRDLPDHDLLR